MGNAPRKGLLLVFSATFLFLDLFRIAPLAVHLPPSLLRTEKTRNETLLLPPLRSQVAHESSCPPNRNCQHYPPT